MTGGGSPEVEIARLEQRVDTADRDIAEIKARQAKDREECDHEFERLRTELKGDKEKQDEKIDGLRRFQAWIMAAVAILGVLLGKLADPLIDKVFK